jgi:hypothetical protein
MELIGKCILPDVITGIRPYARYQGGVTGRKTVKTTRVLSRPD